MKNRKKITGLTEAEALKLQKKHGRNEFQKKKERKALKVFLRQLSNFIVWILIAASIISFSIGENINFWVINLIIAFVILMGFIQEFKAERVMEKLKGIIKPTTNVIRDGNLMTIEAAEVVPGDLLSLEMGDQIPADARVIDVNNLEVDEAPLTGESVSIHKKHADQIYAGTRIVNGKCIAEVTATGMKTELGKIAELVQSKEELTPLQQKLDKLGRLLALIAVSVTLIILIIGVMKGVTFTEILIVALALAVAAVPEGLPLTMTLALSLGMHRMAKKKAVVRRMMAVETLGSTTVICTDKTGTLTRNEMTVEKIYAGDQVISVSGKGYEPKGKFMLKKKVVKKPERWQKLFECLLLCNNANLRETKSGEFKPVGDPTEVALITLSEKAGFRKEQLEEDYERVEEIFFTGERKMMTTIHKTERGHTIFSKGAPEMILEKCTHQLVEGKKTKLSAKKKKEILNQNQDFAKQALRILAAAYKPVKSKKIPEKNVEEELIFLGLAAMKDPARVEVPEAIRKCKKAGIRVIMVTGDNAMTAKSTAAQIGIGNANNKVLTGSDIEKMNDSQMLEALKSVRVFARVHPEHKLRIVKLLKNQDEVVAMTGDGVNDAPALKSSDIGIAMGIKGTDVSKEAADMILQDDNFATIVTAVEEGRRIYHNIEKFTGYLISRNFTEVILILLGILFFDFEFLPLLAIQILLINAFAEEMPAIGLGLDKAHDKIMDKKPRNSDRSFLNQWNAIIVFGAATFMSMLNFIIFLWQDPVDNINLARTMVFSTILVMVIAGTYNFRSMRESVFVTGFSNNRFLIIAVGMIIAVTLSIVYWPPLQSIFSLTSIGPGAWLICIGAGLLNTTFLELLKLLRRKYERTDR